MNTYVITSRTRGTQTYFVDAKTKKEAIELLEAYRSGCDFENTSVRPVSSDVTGESHSYRVEFARRRNAI